MLSLLNFARDNEDEIQNWINKKLQNQNPLLYTSCDVRYSGFKITQVDLNCFPAGFNNLSDEAIELCISLYKKFFNEKSVKNILIYPEFHTRNIGYLHNLLVIKNIFESAGVVVKIASNEKKSYELEVFEGAKILYEEVEKINNTLKVKNSNFTPDLIVLNNDLSKELPEILQNLQTLIYPSPNLGWWKRLKTNHFKAYSEVVNEFAQDFKVDPWFFDSYFDEVSNIDFKNEEHNEILFDRVSVLYHKILAKYQRYGILKTPTIFIKSNRGTYGMGIHAISSLDEVRHFNKNVRKKMDVIRDGIKNTDVIIQEGVETIFTQNQKAVEPVVYSVTSKPVGMFYRINNGNLSNLNSKGMELSNKFEIMKDEKILVNMIASFANIANINELK